MLRYAHNVLVHVKGFVIRAIHIMLVKGMLKVPDNFDDVV